MPGGLPVKALRLELARLLAAGQIEDPVAEAWQLLAAALDLPLARLLAEPGRLVSQEDVTRLRGWAHRRASREPLAYILGQTYFAGLVFATGPGCLVPRPDSEILVETAWQIISGQLAVPKHKIQLLDTFTGSGCIGISLALRLNRNGIPFWLELVDSDERALAWARKNVATHGLADKCRLSRADIFPEKAGPFDLITANPPYIATGQIAGLMAEVKDHEPRAALDGSPDGLYFYKKLAGLAPEMLNPGGWLVLEHGYDQADAVRDIFAGQGYSCQPAAYDFGGNPRVLAVQWPLSRRN
jgi:release factor glutamine methyltransferase